MEDFAKAGASSFNFHYEATADPESLIQMIKKHGMKAGIAIKPATEVSQVEHLLPLLDYVLVMTVEPGFGGQKLITSCIPKVNLLVLIILKHRVR